MPLYPEPRDTSVSDYVGTQIRKQRKYNEWSGTEFAQRCVVEGGEHLSMSAVYSLEGQRRGPKAPRRAITVDELLVVARVLGVEPASLLPKSGA